MSEIYKPRFQSRQRVEEVKLPDGSKTFVKKLSQGVVETINREYFGPANQQKGQAGFRFVACQAACDKAGVRTWSDDDLENLVEEDADVIQAIAVAALKFNGMLNADAKKGSAA